jgi:TolB-like protein/predicted Ser/Thr protein kinase
MDPGTRLGPYEIVAPLGAGGMGEVYRARDTNLRRDVALKLLPEAFAHDAEYLERLRSEAHLLAALNHPNVATIHDLTEADGRRFIVMELVDGTSLRERIGTGSIPAAEAIELGAQIALALQAAHAAGVVHRDLKPDNVLVTPDGRVKVVDFGIAKVIGPPEEADSAPTVFERTQTGVLVGTAPYMSPEQVRGERLDARVDIWALGCLLFELLSGTQAFGRETAAATLAAIIESSPDWSRLSPATPKAVVEIVRACLQKAPHDRIATATELVARLEAASGGTAPAPRLPEPPAPRRGWRPLAGLIVLVLAAIAFWMSRDSPVGSHADGVRLAVLPFSNLRADPGTDFLGYALADQVIGSLVYAQNLVVRPSTSVRRYQSGEYELGEIGADLEVDYVLAGTYLQEDGHTRLNVELVNLDNEETVWREAIELEDSDTFRMQDLVAERLLGRLQVSFTDDERERMTADVPQSPLAYEYYLRSLSYPQDIESNQIAVDMLERSLDLDESFAPAWSALARRQQVISYWDLGGLEATLEARDSYLRALELNPELPSALAGLTTLYTDIGETDFAMTTAQRALAINPNAAEPHFAYGYVLAYAGMLEESATAMTRALEIDPTNRLFRSAAWTYVHLGRYEEAIRTFRLGEENLVAGWEGEIAIREGNFELARRKLRESAGDDPQGITELWAGGVLAALEGDYDLGLEYARRWEEGELTDGQGWFYNAGLYCLNGDVDKCIELFSEAVDRGYFAYEHFLKCRYLDAARDDPRFDAVLEKARRSFDAFKARYF